MARPIYQRVAVTDAGDVIPGAEYTVTNENTGTEQTIYDARSGGSVISQPAFADANGVIQFWTEPGVTYRVEATGGVGTYTDRYVEADTRMADLSDPASGSLMPPGAFGLGGKSILVTGDINILLTTGFYFVQSGGVNLPPGEVSGYLTVQSTGNVASGAAYRVWHSSSSDKMFASYRSAGAWQAWIQFYHTGNLLGTVSQSGGVPTGAVIERGSNTNGDYVKFADGSVLIRRKYSQLWPIGTTIVPLDLPITLLTGYDSFASWSASTAGWLRLGVSELSLSSVNLTVVMDTASTRTVSLFVIGRWF